MRELFFYHLLILGNYDWNYFFKVISKVDAICGNDKKHINYFVPSFNATKKQLGSKTSSEPTFLLPRPKTLKNIV